jgi:hypothetical protein
MTIYSFIAQFVWVLTRLKDVNINKARLQRESNSYNAYFFTYVQIINGQVIKISLCAKMLQRKIEIVHFV